MTERYSKEKKEEAMVKNNPLYISDSIFKKKKKKTVNDLKNPSIPGRANLIF